MAKKVFGLTTLLKWFSELAVGRLGYFNGSTFTNAPMMVDQSNVVFDGNVQLDQRVSVGTDSSEAWSAGHLLELGPTAAIYRRSSDGALILAQNARLDENGKWYRRTDGTAFSSTYVDGKKVELRAVYDLADTEITWTITTYDDLWLNANSKSNVSRWVMTTAFGTPNDSGYWVKIADYTSLGAFRANFAYEINSGYPGGSSHRSTLAKIAVSLTDAGGGIASTTGRSSVEVEAIVGTGLSHDSFKLTQDAALETISLWMRKDEPHHQFAVIETSVQTLNDYVFAGYNSGATWQVDEPIGTLANITSDWAHNKSLLVMTTAAGGGTTEDKEYTWAKLASFSSNAAGDYLSRNFLITGTQFLSGQESPYCTLSISFLDGSSGMSRVKLSILSSVGLAYSQDNFRLTQKTAVRGEIIELWMKKSVAYGKFSLTELSSVATLSGANWKTTYHQNAPWQSATPTGEVVVISTFAPLFGGAVTSDGRHVAVSDEVISGWSTSYRALLIGQRGAIISHTNGTNTEYLENASFDGSNYRYRQTWNALSYQMGNGIHTFRGAPSGTSGNIITWTDILKLGISGLVSYGVGFEVSGINAGGRYSCGTNGWAYTEYYDTAADEVKFAAGYRQVTGLFGISPGLSLTDGLIMDAAGNLGLYATPEQWHVNYRALTLGLRGNSFFARTGTGHAGIVSGAYIDSVGNWKYSISGQPIALYQLTSSGEHRLYTAPAGTAGNSVIWHTAVQIDNDGRPIFSATGDGKASIITYSTAANPYGIAIQFTTAAPNNNSNYFLHCSDTGGTRCRIYSNGDIQNVNNSYGALSDKKLKQDIEDAASQIEDVKKFRICKYRMKSDVEADPNAPYQLGVIANELELISPGLVRDNPDMEERQVVDEDGNPVFDEEGKPKTEIVHIGTYTKSVKYSILYIKAVKALQEEIALREAAEAKLNNLVSLLLSRDIITPTEVDEL